VGRQGLGHQRREEAFEATNGYMRLIENLKSKINVFFCLFLSAIRLRM
jgi:hypothetical protein